MLSWEFPPKSVGGLARHVNDLSYAMSEQGHEVHILTAAIEGAPAEEKINEVYVHRVNPYSIQTPDFIFWTQHFNMALVEKGISLLNKNSFDIIHCHDWMVAFAGRILKHSYKLPLITTIHATERGRNNGIHNEIQSYINSLEWFLTYEAWKVIVCSKYMEREVKSHFSLPEDKVVIVPNGIFPGNFEQETRSSDNLSYINENDRIILYVGRLVQEKGVHVLIDSASKILNSVPNVKFIIVGSGPMEEHLKYKAGFLGDRVVFTGYVSDKDLKKLYQHAEVAVFPSLYEPFGIVALEAMATKTPLVVSDVGGLSEIVNHGVNGLKAYPGNYNSLADNILAVLYDKDLKNYLIKNAVESIKNKYSWENIAKKNVSIYEEVRRDYLKSDWLSHEKYKIRGEMN
jgi:glycogen(starch) synthase